MSVDSRAAWRPYQRLLERALWRHVDLQAKKCLCLENNPSITCFCWPTASHWEKCISWAKQKGPDDRWVDKGFGQLTKRLKKIGISAPKGPKKKMQQSPTASSRDWLSWKLISSIAMVLVLGQTSRLELRCQLLNSRRPCLLICTGNIIPLPPGQEDQVRSRKTKNTEKNALES